MEFDGRSVARANAIPRPSNDVMNTRHPERKKRKKERERSGRSSATKLTFKSRVEGSPVVSSGCHWATSPPCRVSLRGLDAKGKGQFTIAAMEEKRRLGRYRISSSLPVSIIITFIEATARPTWPVSTKLVYIYMYKHQMHHIK